MTEFETLSVVGQIVHTSASLRRSIDQLNRYLHLKGDDRLPPGPARFFLCAPALDMVGCVTARTT